MPVQEFGKECAARLERARRSAETTYTPIGGEPMERKLALAVASTATFLLGSAVVVAASVTNTSFLGFGPGTHAAVALATPGNARPASTIVRRTRNVYDRYVVAAGSDETAGGLHASTPRIAPTPIVPVTAAPATGLPTVGSTPMTTLPERDGPDGNDDTSPTTAPTAHTPVTSPVPTPPSTTTVPTTPTTRPRGVPRDWPTDKPIPPVPPNCREPRLEDNGVWNCDD
jgi:hypothetical protein